MTIPKRNSLLCGHVYDYQKLAIKPKTDMYIFFLFIYSMISLYYLIEVNIIPGVFIIR
jgi:hypothetical protein